MRIVSFYTISLFWICISLPAIGQVQFANRSDLLANPDMHSGVPVAIADMNGDGLDDIINMDVGRRLVIQYQTPGKNRPFVSFELPRQLANNEQNDISIGDFNNDGIQDILMVGSYDDVKVLYGTPYAYEYILETVDSPTFFSQGASTGDFNHDGWLDAVLLNDNGLNYSYINDGTGQLVQQTYFDFVTVPASDNSGNYGCVYTDFDMDGDVDFYIAKCRQGVNNPNDPRRINALFVNDGSGNYTEEAAKYGIANGRQTWTADFGDMDNDGDLDLFLTQHDVESQLFENIDNDTFINITASAGLNIGGIPLQGMFRDFDNDGYQDILVTGDRLDYYHNNGDKTFTKSNPFPTSLFGTFGLGDLNHDGFTDVYASTVEPFNNPDPTRPDMLFLNEGNDNHFLSLHLTETIGNRSAIGAMAILYGPWGTQVREVRGGEQYGVSNSHSMIFGLGENVSYDSLLIRWADGEREWYNNLATDQHWRLTRGGCASLQYAAVDEVVALCGNDSLALFVPDLGKPVQWSTGELVDTLVIKNTGLYYGTYTDEIGCVQITLPVEVIIDPDTIRPVLAFEGSAIRCDGESIALNVSPGLAYEWSTGEQTQTILAQETGEYYVFVEGYCRDLVSDTVYLEFLAADLPVLTPDSILLGDTAVVYATGDSIVWYWDGLGLFEAGRGDTLKLEDLTDTVTIFARNFITIDGVNYTVGPTQHQGTTKYNGPMINGGLIFEVYEPLIIESMVLMTDSAGLRVIEVEGGGFEFSFPFELDSGSNEVILDLHLAEGEYMISTNTDQNNSTFGINSPILWRSSSGVVYPYEINNILSITTSTYGPEFYYYFYGWKIRTADQTCVSELVPVTILVDLETSSGHQPEMVVEMPYPNPVIDVLHVKTNTPVWSWIVTDMTGRIILPEQQEMGLENQLNLSVLTPGVYALTILANNQTQTIRFSKL